MADRATSITPEPGYFAYRMRKGAPEVAAQITHEPTRDPESGEPLDRSWLFAAKIDFEDDPDPSPTPTERVMRVWLHGRRISRDDYDYLLKDAEWCRAYAPDEPRASPRQAADLRKMRPLVP